MFLVLFPAQIFLQCHCRGVVTQSSNRSPHAPPHSGVITWLSVNGLLKMGIRSGLYCTVETQGRKKTLYCSCGLKVVVLKLDKTRYRSQSFWMSFLLDLSETVTHKTVCLVKSCCTEQYPSTPMF